MTMGYGLLLLPLSLTLVLSSSNAKPQPCTMTTVFDVVHGCSTTFVNSTKESKGSLDDLCKALDDLLACLNGNIDMMEKCPERLQEILDKAVQQPTIQRLKTCATKDAETEDDGMMGNETTTGMVKDDEMAANKTLVGEAGNEGVTEESMDKIKSDVMEKVMAMNETAGMRDEANETTTEAISKEMTTEMNEQSNGTTTEASTSSTMEQEKSTYMMEGRSEIEDGNNTEETTTEMMKSDETTTAMMKEKTDSMNDSAEVGNEGQSLDDKKIEEEMVASNETVTSQATGKNTDDRTEMAMNDEPKVNTEEVVKSAQTEMGADDKEALTTKQSSETDGEDADKTTSDDDEDRDDGKTSTNGTAKMIDSETAMLGKNKDVNAKDGVLSDQGVEDAKENKYKNVLIFERFYSSYTRCKVDMMADTCKDGEDSMWLQLTHCSTSADEDFKIYKDILEGCKKQIEGDIFCSTEMDPEKKGAFTKCLLEKSWLHLKFIGELNVS